MGLMDKIIGFEQEQKLDEEYDPTKCENYRNGYEGPYCVWHQEECIGPCNDWELGEFWQKRKGYQGY